MLIVVITIVLGVALAGLRSARTRPSDRVRKPEASPEIRMAVLRAHVGPARENGVSTCSG